jgi:ParB-like chromosome segregation protein Spo0J
MANKLEKNMSEMAGAVSLKVLAERKIEGVNKQTQFKVDPRIIEIEPGFNARPIDRDHVEAFKASIKAGSIVPPMFVRVEDGRIILVDGHHRETAYLELIEEGVEILSVDVIQFRGSDADRIAHMITTSQGLPLTPLQLGVSYRKLVAFGWTPAQIAAKVGKSSTHVSQCILLGESNSDVQGMVARKEVAAHLAIKTVKKHGSNAGSVLADHLEAARLSGKSKVTEKTVEGATPTKSLADAIQMEIDSGGSFRAEALCPRYVHLIMYLRNFKTVERLAEEMKAA